MTLFAEALATDWPRLSPVVRAFHDGPATRFRGKASVEHGRSPIARSVATAFGFPPESPAIPVTITVERAADGSEYWHRAFGNHRLSTHLTAAGPGQVRERIGPAAFDLALRVGPDGALMLDVARGTLFGIPLPRPLLPVSTACEAEDATGRFAFDIAVRLRLLGPMIRYRGWLLPAG